MVINTEIAGIKIGDAYPPRIMAIINLSPTSYYKGSIKISSSEISQKLETFIQSKVEIVDVGAISSAPSFLYGKQEKISSKEEIARLKTFFEAFNDIDSNIIVSIDTQSATTAEFALSQGAKIINDISGLKFDSNLPKVISNWDAGVIMMACKKFPGDVYTTETVTQALEESIKLGKKAGINEAKMIIDPGLGGWTDKRNEKHDFTLITKLTELKVINKPILVGISRKSFIGKILNKPPEERLWGSLSATTVAILNGAHIIRTHDPEETKDCVIISEYIAKLVKRLN